MLLIYGDETPWTKPSARHATRNRASSAHELTRAGQFLAASPLQPTSTATSVRVRDGKRLVTDGPFAETREQLGGYFLVDAKDLDEAIGIAGRIPVARAARSRSGRSSSCRACPRGSPEPREETENEDV